MKMPAIILMVCGIVALLPALDFWSFVGQKKALWDLDANAVEEKFPKYFKYVDNTNQALRFNGSGRNALYLTVGDADIYEIIITLKDQKIRKISMSLYNRGDSGKWTEDKFKKVLDEARAQIVELVGKNVIPVEKNDRLSGEKVNLSNYSTVDMDVVLRWSGASNSNREPEYLYIDVYYPGEGPKDLRKDFKIEVVAKGLEKNIKNDEFGRYLDIPMVDQGQKGYCVAAAVERVMRYYGSNVDQHTIAQVADSDSDRGTSVSKTVEVLERLENKFGIRVKLYYSFNEFDSIGGFNEFINNYNRVAKQAKKKQLNPENYQGAKGKYSPDKFLGVADLEVITQVRQKEKADYKKFIEIVHEKIDGGIPVLWGTYIFPGQDDAIKLSRHVRIINGYNDKEKSLIYTDSWGAGHERKKMKFEDAFGITTVVIGLEPKKIK